MSTSAYRNPTYANAAQFKRVATSSPTLSTPDTIAYSKMLKVRSKSNTFLAPSKDANGSQPPNDLPASTWSQSTDNNSPQRSSEAKEPSFFLGRDLFSRLPKEILLQIVDELNIESYVKPNPLHSISCLNRNLNAFTHMFLWRSFLIVPRSSSKGAQINIDIHDQTDALLRDPHRAAYIQHLTIELSFNDAILMPKISTIFSMVLNLKKLNLHVSQTSPDESGLSHALARAMGTLTYPMPFQLEELECEASLFNSSLGIYTFLRTQPSIQRLTIRRIPSTTPFWSAPSIMALDAEYGIYREGALPLLPSIKEFYGPASYARLLLHGTQHPLTRIVLHTRNIWNDSCQEQPRYRLIHGQHSSHFQHPSTHSSDPPTAPLVCSQSLSLWANDPSSNFITVMTRAYAIDPSSLRFLRFGCTFFHKTAAHDMNGFPSKILCELPVLEELEWLIFFKGSLNKDSFKVQDVTSIRGPATAFLDRAMRQSTSKRLRRFEFFASKKRRLELMRFRMGDDGASDVIVQEREEQEGQGTQYLELSNGSTWKIWIKGSSMGETDFYTLEPDEVVGL
ncbi:hypothetical protein DL93DRAFT_2164438 [Clavulina sp. PMI_390]|nr:hypothetical protein DL93DRAFT_2164438 [Clavulina sp. PMI_390]